MIGVMNNTKWEELRMAMYGLGRLSPKFRVKTIGVAETSAWDGEWFYHFRCGGYDSIEWVELRVVSVEQRDAVRKLIHDIHVPGVETAIGFRVLGWVQPGDQVAFIS